LCIGTDDINLVAILEFGNQRRMPSIDLAAHTAVTYGGMHRIGKIDGRGTARKSNELPLWREAEYLVMEQFQLGVFEKFLGAFPFLQHFHQMAQPAIGVGLRPRRAKPIQGLFRIGRILVERVGGHATLGNFVHEPRADLHLDPHVMGANDNRMQRAVIILLWR